MTTHLSTLRILLALVLLPVMGCDQPGVDSAPTVPPIATNTTFFPGPVVKTIPGTYPWMGVSVTSRLQVGAVKPGGPAEQAGIQVRDTIVAIDGNGVFTPTELAELLRVRYRAGDTVVVTVVRDGLTQDIEVELAETPPLVASGQSDDEPLSEECLEDRPADIRRVLTEAHIATRLVAHYSVLISATVLYEDQTQRDTWMDVDLWFEPNEVQVTPHRRVKEAQQRFTDLLLRSLEPSSDSVARSVLRRQPGLLSRVDMAVEFIACTDSSSLVVEPTQVGETALRLTAEYPQRPDFEIYHNDLMTEIYENAPMTVTVWINRTNHLVDRIESITRGLSYPPSLPEPNDLRGAVEERITLVFSNYEFF